MSSSFPNWQLHLLRPNHVIDDVSELCEEATLPVGAAQVELKSNAWFASVDCAELSLHSLVSVAEVLFDEGACY